MTSERRIEDEIEVPVTPEQAWEAIATGPGISPGSCRPTSTAASAGRSCTATRPTSRRPGTITGLRRPARFAYEERAGWPTAPTPAT
jgi:hypothetical protein